MIAGAGHMRHALRGWQALACLLALVITLVGAVPETGNAQMVRPEAGPAASAEMAMSHATDCCTETGHAAPSCAACLAAVMATLEPVVASGALQARLQLIPEAQFLRLGGPGVPHGPPRLA